MKHTISIICSILIISWLCIGTVSLVSADIITNIIQAFPANDGSCALLVNLMDTITSNHWKGSLTIFDKKNNKIVDESQLGGYADYIISDYDGKRLLQRTPEGVATNQYKFILYKVTRKGLKKSNEQVVDNASFGTIYKSFITVYQIYNGASGFTVFNKTLKKVLYTIPPQAAQMFVMSDKGIIVAHSQTPADLIVKLYKHGKVFAEHSLPLLSDGNYRTKADPKGGLLYWVTIGPLSSPTNLPLTYIDAKGKIKAENVTLEDAEVDFRANHWNGKYLYIQNIHAHSLAAYKLTKTAVKMGEVTEPDNIAALVDKSHVYLFITSGSDSGIIEYDKKLNKKKWTEPTSPGTILYLGKGVFRREDYVDNGTTGFDFTLTFFRKGKIFATQTYTQPY
jgi:hypothetical protein